MLSPTDRATLQKLIAMKLLVTRDPREVLAAALPEEVCIHLSTVVPGRTPLELAGGLLDLCDLSDPADPAVQAAKPSTPLMELLRYINLVLPEPSPLIDQVLARLSDADSLDRPAAPVQERPNYVRCNRQEHWSALLKALRQPEPKALCWCGPEGEGHYAFAERLRYYLQDELPDRLVLAMGLSPSGWLLDEKASKEALYNALGCAPRSEDGVRAALRAGPQRVLIQGRANVQMDNIKRWIEYSGWLAGLIRGCDRIRIIQPLTYNPGERPNHEFQRWLDTPLFKPLPIEPIEIPDFDTLDADDARRLAEELGRPHQREQIAARALDGAKNSDMIYCNLQDLIG